MEHIDKKPEIRNFSPVEAAWLAATIDGEGSIGLYDYGKEGRRVQIQIGNTNEKFVARMREIIGAGSSICRTNLGKDHKGRKPIYYYSLKGSARCYWVLIQIVDLLIIKKQKAQEIISELENKPFGRWAACTEDKRKLQSELMKEIWRKKKQLYRA